MAKVVIKPVSAGELDGLSGIYSIINAVKFLFPKDSIDDQKLFNFLIDKVEEKNNPKLSTLLKDNISKQNLTYLINQTISGFSLTKEKDIELVTNDKKSLDTKKIDTAVKELKEFLLDESNKARRAVLLYISGKANKWICLSDIKDKSLVFHDNVTKSINISDLHITEDSKKAKDDSYYVYFKNIILLEAKRG